MSGNSPNDTSTGKTSANKTSTPSGSAGSESGAPAAEGSGSKPDAGSPSPLNDSNVGVALRSVYPQTNNEDIPADMLDRPNKQQKSAKRPHAARTQQPTHI